ncbi:hypothetical protein B296_00008262 [Ensete ventricosum]|uniref:Uncharacterized protein n=1 Tax=Ensete ventricosum TaxID=4639 RepID=A0A426YUX7_ENSVE|nr:hypothetical protein B296_00008262 [Ensete ventricosum]
MLAAIKAIGSERLLLVAFLSQEITAGYDQRGWQRKITAGSVTQRGIAAGCDQVAAGRDQSRWQREIAAAAMKTDGSEGCCL